MQTENGREYNFLSNDGNENVAEPRRESRLEIRQIGTSNSFYTGTRDERIVDNLYNERLRDSDCLENSEPERKGRRKANGKEQAFGRRTIANVIGPCSRRVFTMETNDGKLATRRPLRRCAF